MPKEFGAWFADQGKGETEEVDETFHLTCRHCGKEDYLTIGEYESGDMGWYTDDGIAPGLYLTGLCGSGYGCTP